MAKLTEQDFKKELSSGDLKNLYLIYGEEKYLVKKYTEQLYTKAAGKEPSDFDFVKLGSSSPIEDIISASEQLPVFSGYKCVVVTDYNAESLNDSDIKLIEKFFSDISPSTVLIFTMPTKELGDSKKTADKKSGKFKKFVSLTEKYGNVLELQKRGDIALEKQLVSWAEKGGCRLDRINASKIIASCGTDMTLLRNETDKLIAYADGGEIDEKMIKMLVVKNTEVRIFALSECISKGDYNGAYKQLFILFEQNEKPEVILSVLSSVYIDMYRMRVASESGKTISDVSSDFKYGKREFILKNAQNNSRRYSTKTLRRFLDIILDTDMKINKTSYSSKGGRELIKIKEAVIVEGKYDKIRLSNFIDGLIITTDGFGIFKDKEKQRLIKHLADTRGILILTDSDGAGFVIRNFLKGAVSSDKIKHAYIPDISGKEKRKDKPSKEGKLGVEGISDEIIMNAISRSGAECELCEEKERTDSEITKADLFELGLTGCPNAAENRDRLKKRLSLPENMTSNSMLDVLNFIMTKQELKEIMDREVCECSK